MSQFDPTPISDLALTDAEISALQTVLSKSKLDQAKWGCNTQEFLESFTRCIRVAIPCFAVPSVVFAQAVQESGWFSTGVLFGVKATGPEEQAGAAETDGTTEVVNGKLIDTAGVFFHALSIQQAFANYYAYVTRRKPGTQQFLPGQVAGYITYLQNGTIFASNGKPSGAYSTAGSQYVLDILSIIKDNNLAAFDHF